MATEQKGSYAGSYHGGRRRWIQEKMWEENWQGLVIIWIYGVKKKQEIKKTPTSVTSVTMDANTEEGVGMRRRIDTMSCFVHTVF